MLRVKDLLLQLSDWLEVIISVLLVLMVCGMGIDLVREMFTVDLTLLEQETIQYFMEYSFNLVIVIEFVRMLSKHSAGSIVEIILFSIAREMIVEHQNALDTFILIAAILIIFIIRKYFLLKHDNEEYHEVSLLKKHRKEKEKKNEHNI